MKYRLLIALLLAAQTLALSQKCDRRGVFGVHYVTPTTVGVEGGIMTMEGGVSILIGATGTPNVKDENVEYINGVKQVTTRNVFAIGLTTTLLYKLARNEDKYILHAALMYGGTNYGDWLGVGLNLVLPTGKHAVFFNPYYDWLNGQPKLKLGLYF